jgi:Spy/CpxP family protein refolding chaperone
MKKTTIVGLGVGLGVVLGLALVITSAMACGPGFSRGLSMRPELVFPDIPILGEKQFHKVEALEKVFLKEIEPLQHDVLTKRTELRILELATDPDPTAVEAEQKEIRTLRSEIQEKVINLRFEIWKVLNPEQRAQFDPFGTVASHPSFVTSDRLSGEEKRYLFK